MSKQRNRALRAAALAAPAGFLALAITAGCDRSSQETGPAGEPPPMDEAAEGADPAAERAPAQAGGEGADPHAQAGDPGAMDPSGAPGGEPPGMAGGAAPQGEPVSDEDLEAFAEAYLEIEDVQGELEAELRAAQSNEQAQEIQQRAMTEIRDAVEETGMDFETYGMIAQRLQQDPELIQRVEETIESKRDGS